VCVARAHRGGGGDTGGVTDCICGRSVVYSTVYAVYGILWWLSVYVVCSAMAVDGCRRGRLQRDSCRLVVLEAVMCLVLGVQ
jgi:hypothetical protein